jgi:hypothetical protein
MSDHWGAPRPPEPNQPEVLSDRPNAQDVATPAAYTSFSTTGTFLPAEPPERTGGKGKWVAGGVAVLLVAGVGVGAAYAAGALGGGGGKQPESFVPSTSVAFVSFDLDPSLGQKVDALRFLRKFPSAKASLGSTDDIREYIFDQATADDPKLSGLKYATDVKPWIGNRFGVAVLPGATAGDEPNPVVVLQVSDSAKAKAGLKKLMTPGDGTCTVSDGYAVCAQTQAVLTQAETATRHESLAQDQTFTSDVSSTGSRGIATAWGDLAKLSKLVPSGVGGGGLAGLSSFGAVGANQTIGRFVATLRFTGANLQLTGRVTGGKPSAAVTGGTGVEQLPTTTAVAVGASTSAATITKGYQQTQAQLKATGGARAVQELQQGLRQFGLKLPQDLSSLLGTKFAVAYGGTSADGEPQIGLRSNASETKAGPVLDKVGIALRSAGAPFELHHVRAGSGYAVALDPAYARQLAAAGGLGANPAFRAAAPDAGSANLVIYLNVARLLAGGGGSPFGSASGSANANLAALSAVGLTAHQGSDGTATFHLNVVTR